MSAPQHSPLWPVFGALAVALAAAYAVVVLTDSSAALPAVEPAVVSFASVDPPIPAPGTVRAASERAVSPSVLATADAKPPLQAPGVLLKRTRREGEWEDYRAELEDQETGDVRAYAIGDLVPHGSLLVAIGDDSADVLVADSAIVRLTTDGRVEPREAFRIADSPPAIHIRSAPDLDAEYQRRAAELIDLLRSEDPVTVQAAIDALVAGGEPVVELLVPHTDSALPLPRGAYEVSSTGRLVEPVVQGDLVIAILERITGQTFGDPTRPGLLTGQRDDIARAWKSWWGVE